MFKVGDLVEVTVRHDTKCMGIIVEPYYSPAGCEWLVNRLNGDGNIICCPTDLEMVNESR